MAKGQRAFRPASDHFQKSSRDTPRLRSKGPERLRPESLGGVAMDRYQFAGGILHLHLR
jgi:hypothetical protein